MSESAQVHSLDLLKRLQLALVRFGSDAESALGTADREIRRVEMTLHEKLKYWNAQVIKRQEQVMQARAALSHARAMHDGKSVGCVEQELALRKAQNQLKEAEDKVATTKRWIRELPNIVKDFDGPARSLAGYIDSDLKQGIVQLDGRIAALEAYMQILAGGPEGQEAK